MMMQIFSAFFLEYCLIYISHHGVFLKSCIGKQDSSQAFISLSTVEMLFLFHVALKKLSSPSKQDISSKLNAGIKFPSTQDSQQETTLS